jgi:probable HAF family extracellular repeat protein
MKLRMIASIFFSCLLVALATPAGFAQERRPASDPPTYKVINLGTLGGTVGTGDSINNEGFVAGSAYLSGDTNQHAILWLAGLKIDLGTLGGPNSASIAQPTLFAQVAAYGETTVSDPNGEDYCGNGTNLICLPFIWEFGARVVLPTLGGNNAEAADMNNFGEVVGNAETATADSTCLAPQVLQHLPAVWEHGHVKALPTFGGDPAGVAIANNDKGQAAGFSGTCNTGAFTSGAHALFWDERGNVTDLGNLGGVMNNYAQAINERGDVVGYSDVSGDTTTHAFLWSTATGIQDLGTVAGDAASYGIGANDLGQVVGAIVRCPWELPCFSLAERHDDRFEHTATCELDFVFGRGVRHQ